MIDGDLINSYWWSNGNYDWIMIDMGVSQPVGRVFVNFGYWYLHGTGVFKTKTMYVNIHLLIVLTIKLSIDLFCAEIIM